MMLHPAITFLAGYVLGLVVMRIFMAVYPIIEAMTAKSKEGIGEEDGNK